MKYTGTIALKSILGQALKNFSIFNAGQTIKLSGLHSRGTTVNPLCVT